MIYINRECVIFIHHTRMGAFDGVYKWLMKRNSVYVAFIIGGAFLGEQAIDYTFDSLWKWNNRGKLFEDLVLGEAAEEE